MYGNYVSWFFLYPPASNATTHQERLPYGSTGRIHTTCFPQWENGFKSGKAVADLIASSSAATHRLAMSQMRGGFSKELTDLRNKLLNFTSMIELELDFSEEDVEFADRSALRKLADEIEQVISRLVHSFSVGNAIKNGVPVAIIGETNAGNRPC